MQLSCQVPVLLRRTDKARNGNGAAIGEEERHLGYTADVLFAIRGGEAEILVKAEADIVAVEAVGGVVVVEEVLLEGGGDGRFARGGEAGEPDGETFLMAKE